MRGGREALRGEDTALSPDEVFGAQVVARREDAELRGELLACDGRGIFMSLNESGAGRWQRVEWSTLRVLRLRREGLGIGGVLWVAAGVLSAPLLGWLAPVGGPLWAALGTPTAVVSFAPSEPSDRCAPVRAYARFPQGLPRAMWSRFGAEASGDAPWTIRPSSETLAEDTAPPPAR